ncbi:hypothetical protein SAMN03159391_04181 [Pseudomonas sp. NFACC37-1]|nr:hypothetical protein SAMN03159391_04181 [Pseudomonas sp. NFACC37-1]SFO58571.1 hypothetical protein SAMN03159304_04037 [Pseudomonas sp. NFACC24-1]
MSEQARLMPGNFDSNLKDYRQVVDLAIEPVALTISAIHCSALLC